MRPSVETLCRAFGILEQPTDCRRNDAKDESALDDTPATPLTATKTMVKYAENDLSACVGPPGARCHLCRDALEFAGGCSARLRGWDVVVAHE